PEPGPPDVAGPDPPARGGEARGAGGDPAGPGRPSEGAAAGRTGTAALAPLPRPGPAAGDGRAAQPVDPAARLRPAAAGAGAGAAAGAVHLFGGRARLVSPRGGSRAVLRLPGAADSSRETAPFRRGGLCRLGQGSGQDDVPAARLRRGPPGRRSELRVLLEGR